MTPHERDQRIEARLFGLEVLATGLFGILAKTRVVPATQLLSELSACEAEMRKLNGHEALIEVLRTAREHVESAGEQ